VRREVAAKSRAAWRARVIYNAVQDEVKKKMYDIGIVARWIFFYFNSIFSPSVYIHYIHILLHDDLHFIHGYRVIIYLSVSFCTGESKKRNSFLFVQRTVIELNDDDSIILPPNHNVSVFYTYIPIYIMYCARVNNYTTLYYYIRIA